MLIKVKKRVLLSLIILIVDSLIGLVFQYNDLVYILNILRRIFHKENQQ